MNIKEAIQENHKSLKLFIEKGMYLHTSVPLRVLLCDSNPLLIKFVEQQNRPLIVWTSMTLEETSPGLLEGLQTEIRTPCKWDPREVRRRNKFPLVDFLTRKFCAADDGNHYTPQQIIKATANKLGFTHFDENRQKYLQDSIDIKTIKILDDGTIMENSLVDNHLLELSKWTLEAIDYLNLNEMKFSIFLAIDNIETAIGESTIFCVQTGLLLTISFEDDRLLIKTKEKTIELVKKNDSFICILGENGVMKISSNLLEKDEIILYSNIITSNSIRVENSFNGMKGNLFLFNRILEEFEIQELIDKESRVMLSKEIEEEKENKSKT